EITHFLIDAPRWTPGADLAGKTFLVCGEQGLGDEVLFANVLPDIVERLGPEGPLQLSVWRRLVPLFEPRFPSAQVLPHGTYSPVSRPARVVIGLKEAELDLWTPIASLLTEFRRSHADFPSRIGYLKADPDRVAHWKAVLETAPAGPKVGLLW